jgi:hypothetical protein
VVDIEMNFSLNFIEIIVTILSWIIIGFLGFKIASRADVKLSLWKIILVVIVGLFSFSIKLVLFDIPLDFAILPLGLWVLYYFLKTKEGRWERYRQFAWLGFWANYLFLIMAIVSVLVHAWIYPKDQVDTYLSEAEDATLIAIHPAGKENQVFLPKKFFDQLDSLTTDRIMNNEWYIAFYGDTDSTKRSERFPYQLDGAKSKWGSGLQPLVFIEDDGKGILVTTAKRQLYFRSNESLIDGGASR